VLQEKKDSGTAKKGRPVKTAETAPAGNGTRVHPVITNLLATKDQFPEEYLAACQALGIEPDADIRVPEALKIMAEINAIVDKANS